MNKTIILGMIRRLYPGVNYISINVPDKTMRLLNDKGETKTAPADAYSEHLPALAEGYDMKEICEITIDMKTKEVKMIGDKIVTI